MNFFSRTVAERTSSGQRQSIQDNNYVAHAYSRAGDGLAGVIVTDQDYPVRVVFSLLNKILEEFATKVTKATWEAKANEGRRTGKAALCEFPQLNEYIVKYQDPKQADTIMKVQQELDETKIILVSSNTTANTVGAGQCAEWRRRPPTTAARPVARRHDADHPHVLLPSPLN